MKKFAAIIVTAIITMLMLTGCSFHNDTEPAIVEITTTDGRTYLSYSFNNSWNTVDPLKAAMQNCLKINLEEGEEANLHFYCNACGHDEEYSVSEAESKLFQCDCPTQGDDEGNLKEYLVVLISQVPEEELTAN